MMCTEDHDDFGNNATPAKVGRGLCVLYGIEVNEERAPSFYDGRGL